MDQQNVQGQTSIRSSRGVISSTLLRMRTPDHPLPTPQFHESGRRASQEQDFIRMRSQVLKATKRCFCCPRKNQSTHSKYNSQGSEISFKRSAKYCNSLEQILRNLTAEKRMQKAVRHLHDAMYVRSVNNDLDYLDNSIVKYIWLLSNSDRWNSFLWMITAIYQLLTFFEPSHSYSDEPYDLWMITTESVILGFYILDYLLVLLIAIALEQGVKRAFLNSKHLFKLVFLTCFLVDFSWMLMKQPGGQVLRFSRILRVLIFAVYSKDLRRNIKGILGSLKQLIILFLFYFLIIGVWAFVGNNILITENQNLDQSYTDYTDFFQLFNMLFVLSTMDFYPDIATPLTYDSIYYMSYFVPYVVLFMFVLGPIPLAVVYEGFRNFRTEIIVNDRIKQKTALLTCFLCLDPENKGHISEKDFIDFLHCAYDGQLTEKESYDIYQLVDENCSGKVSIDEFFELQEIIEDTPKLHLDRIHPPNWWVDLRTFCNQKLNLRAVLEGSAVTTFMLLITLANCTFIIVALFITDEEVLSIFKVIDTVFLGIYIFEALTKMVALGIEDYFDDDWNKFDFFLILFQIIFDFILYNLLSQTLVTSFKVNRVLRLAKIQKVFRLFRAFRTIKIVTFFMAGFQIFSDVKDLIYKIILCIPVIMRLVSIVWIIFFIYATVGVELLGVGGDSPYLDYDCLESEEIIYSWGSCNYASFDTFGGAFLLLLQTFVAAQWGQLIFDYAYKTDSLLSVALYFGTFVFLSIFIQALIGGLVWEVFTLVDKAVTNEAQINKEKDEAIECDSPSHQNLPQINLPLPPISEETPVQSQSIIQMNRKGQRKGAINLGSQQVPNNTIRSKVNKTLVLENMVLSLDRIPSTTRFFQIQRNMRTNSIQLNSTQNSSQVNKQRPKHMYVQQKILSNQSLEQDEQIMLQSVKDEQREDEIEIEGSKNEEEDMVVVYRLVSNFYKNKFINLSEFRRNNNVDMEDFIQSYCNQIKEDLREMSTKERKNVSSKSLITSAILKHANQNEIQSKEYQHFLKTFGSQFERLRETKLSNLLSIESRILFDLNTILKFSDFNTTYFTQILLCLEFKMQEKLLRPGSFIKLIHQLSNGAWFQISVDQDGLKLLEVQDGPWQLIDELLVSSPRNARSNPSSFVEKSLTIAEDLDFMALESCEKQEWFTFRQSLITISKQFQPLSEKTFDNEQFKFAMLDLKNNHPEEIRGDVEKSKRIKKSDDEWIERSVVLALVRQTVDEQSTQLAYLPFHHVLDFVLEIGLTILNHNVNYFTKIQEIYSTTISTRA